MVVAVTRLVLRDGRVLLVGGYMSDVGGGGPSAELYDPVTGKWTMAALVRGMTGSTATLPLDGTVLVAGGTFVGNPSNEAYLYHPVGP